MLTGSTGNQHHTSSVFTCVFVGQSYASSTFTSVFGGLVPVLYSQVFWVVSSTFTGVFGGQSYATSTSTCVYGGQSYATSTFTGFFCGQSYVMSKSQVLGGHSYARSSFTGVCLVVSLMPVLHSQVFLWPVLCQFYIHRYTFTLDPKYPVKKKLAAIMRTESGMRMFATPRTPSL